jgi:hypothetical protein
MKIKGHKNVGSLKMIEESLEKDSRHDGKERYPKKKKGCRKKSSTEHKDGVTSPFLPVNANWTSHLRFEERIFNLFF